MAEANQFFAHSTSNMDRSDWEPLSSHLDTVAELAGTHASRFGSAEWGRLAGLWHDLGKYHPRFQQRLSDSTVTQPHSGAGAWLAKEKNSTRGMPLAAVIAGHHAGLANWLDGATLGERLARAQANEWPQTKPHIPSRLLDFEVPQVPAFLKTKTSSEFWTRMLFSALVDADRLCTERFHDPGAPARRAGSVDLIPELCQRLEDEVARIHVSLSDEARARPLHRCRREVSEACSAAAKEERGIFSLTVPTGGGKTLASMRFALNHAVQRDLGRVIVVIPYTSIIEQNAEQYARIFGRQNLIEHHSNLDIERRLKVAGEAVADWQDLAAENWDAPIIVTTTVQFFESLFTNHPSRARKLHNIANSVIILDEVQSLPPDKLLTLLDGLKELCTHYGCSIVLCTATPPALLKSSRFTHGLENVREIINNPAMLASQLNRVKYEWPVPGTPPVEWPALAEQIAKNASALVVTHRRADARELARELERCSGKDAVLHLSALMCPAHRLDVLRKVRSRLSAAEPCILVSTTLIEAGVDIDFPVVYRALAGLDSIVQAAGRCNREGRLDKGRVVVFRAPTKPPSGVPGLGLAVTEVMLNNDESINADNPETQVRYFTQLYGASDLDRDHIQRERERFNFATVAEKFRLIEDGFTETIIVPYGAAMERVGDLQQAVKRGDANLRDRFRALQPFTVSVYRKAFDAAMEAGALVGVEGCEGIHFLRAESKDHYHPKYGLVIGDDIGVMNAGALLVYDQNPFEWRNNV